MRDVFIYEAVRSPRGKGKAGGSLYTLRPIALLAQVMRELARRLSLDTRQIDDVVLGCVTPIGEQGGNIARVAALYAGWDVSVPGVTLNRFCASGLEAVNLAAAKIACGLDGLVVAGGIESMSRVPMGSDGGAWIIDPDVNASLAFVPQGISADLIATMEGFSRQSLDEFAVRSHQRAAAAWADQRFTRSVVPMTADDGQVLLDRDEMIRPETTASKLAALDPAFAEMGAMGFDDTALRQYPAVEQIQHVHHAGNSSGIVDGAALVLLGSAEAGRRMGLKPRAKIRAFAQTGTEPTIMLTGPGPATRQCLERAKLRPEDIDIFEVNEAFAAVVLKFQRELRIPDEKINPNGGAIAMGHPLGATGAMLVGMCVDELERNNGRFGLVTLCVGAGMGVATIVERVNGGGQ